MENVAHTMVARMLTIVRCTVLCLSCWCVHRLSFDKHNSLVTLMYFTKVCYLSELIYVMAPALTELRFSFSDVDLSYTCVIHSLCVSLCLCGALSAFVYICTFCKCAGITEPV